MSNTPDNLDTNLDNTRPRVLLTCASNGGRGRRAVWRFAWTLDPNLDISDARTSAFRKAARDAGAGVEYINGGKQAARERAVCWLRLRDVPCDIAWDIVNKGTAT
jgi:hypothetical protein